MGTDVRADSDEYGRAMGDTVWAARLEADQIFGLAWEWIEVKPGVAAIRDPNGFVSNVRLLDKHGDELEDLLSVVHLNRIAHTTPWQEVVSHVVRASEGAVELRAASGPSTATRVLAAKSELALLRQLVANLPSRARALPGRAAG